MAAGGEPAHPALNGGRDLKQRRIGLFWSLPAFQRRRGLLKRLVLHCQVSGREIPDQSTAAQFGLTPRRNRVSIVRSRQRTQVRELFERAPSLGSFGGCYDR